MNSLEDSVSKLLRSGVLLCAAFIFGGLLVAFVSGDSLVFATTTAVLRGATLPDGALRPLEVLQMRGGVTSPEGWVTLGLALLIALPAIRVAWLVFAFAKNGERRMAWLAGVVLCLLAGGLFFSAVHS